jgi:hypothetical protein
MDDDLCSQVWVTRFCASKRDTQTKLLLWEKIEIEYKFLAHNVRFCLQNIKNKTKQYTYIFQVLGKQHFDLFKTKHYTCTLDTS